MNRTLPAILVAASITWATEGEAEAVASYLKGAEILVTARRGEDSILRTPASAHVILGIQIEDRGYRTTPQILSETPGVMVQETAPGQGSPYIRGFTGFLNLFLIDGIRLNNSVFRPGPNQYWSTVDPFSIARLEIVKGPSSVLYGSDAVGGTVQAITRNPHGMGGRVVYRGATAENSHAGRAEVSLSAAGGLGALLGLSTRRFGDLIAGGDVDRQTGTGYEEWDGDVKVEYLPDDRTRYVLAYQHVRQNNVPRTHRTIEAVPFHGTTPGNEILRDSDQERWLVYLQAHREKMEGFIEVMRTSLSWHDQSEVRHRIRPPSGGGTTNRVDFQGMSAGTLGAWLQLESPTPAGRLTYGLEVYHDIVNSFSTSNPLQGPVADDATYDLVGAYLQDVVPLGEEWELTAGARLNWARVDADSVSDPVSGGALSIRDDWTAVVGSARVLRILVPERWTAYGGLSQGFRAPNLSDLTMFDSARSGEFEIPSPGLRPEYYATAELGLKGRPGPHHIEVAVFYTWIRDAIDRFPNGETTTSGDPIITKANLGDGYICGIELSGDYEIVPGLRVVGDVTYLLGRTDTYADSTQVLTREYITRLMPLTAHVGLRYEQEGRYWVDGLVAMADRADRLSPGDMRDTERIPPGGTPGYAVLSLRAGWSPDRHTRLALSFENLLDKAYRIHGSGHTMPGRSLVFTVSRDF